MQASTNCRTLAITPVDLQPQRSGTNALTTRSTTKSYEYDSNASTHRLVNDHSSHIIPWLQAVQQALMRTEHQFVQST